MTVDLPTPMPPIPHNLLSLTLLASPGVGCAFVGLYMCAFIACQLMQLLHTN